MLPRNARRIIMDPTTTCCPNLACPARGQRGQGNIGIHSCKDKRFICTECHKTCSVTKGTAFYRLRTSAETVSLVLTRIAHGCPPRHDRSSGVPPLRQPTACGCGVGAAGVV